MTIPFVDCQGLGGAWTLGTAQTGRFELVHRASQPGGFGDSSIDRNISLLNARSDFWHEDPEGHLWEPFQAGYVCGTPPCSGFSLMNASKKGNKRGPDSPINSCMKDLAKYGARCIGLDGQKGAEFIAFESVQQAYSTGRELMQELRAIIEAESGQKYDLTHVLMSGASVGNAQYRHRYYFVAHRVSFQIAHPEPHKVVTYRDAIGDLEGLDLQWEDQPYRRDPAELGSFGDRLRRDDGFVDAHQAYQETRDAALLVEIERYLKPGQSVKDLLENDLDEPPQVLLERFPYTKDDWKELRGWQWFKRVNPDKPGFVVSGGGAGDFVHWSEPRFLTIREITRLMGYPDEWRWPEEVSSVNVASALVGKCCPVDSGRWISEAVADALEGQPQFDPERIEIGEREFLHNSSLDYRRWPREISCWSLK